MVQIQNSEDVGRFINGLPKERRVDVASALVSRTALRVVPFVIGANEEHREQLILTSLRAILTSGARCNCTAPEVREDLRAASASATAATATATAAIADDAIAIAAATAAAAIAADATAASAADATATAAYVYAAASATVSYKTVQRDAERLMVDIANGFAHPLWTDAELTADPGFQTNRDNLLAFFDAAPETWSFWRRWYVALWKGSPMDWDLPTQVALINDEDWKKGAAHIAAEIAKVEEKFITETLPQVEDIERGEDGQYRVVVRAVTIENTLERALTQVSFATDVALGGNCGFSRMCVSYKYLEHTFEHCRDDANTVEQHFGIAQKTLEDNLVNGEYYDPAPINALILSLERQRLQIRGDVPEVGAAYTRRVAQKLQEIDDDT